MRKGEGELLLVAVDMVGRVGVGCFSGLHRSWWRIMHARTRSGPSDVQQNPTVDDYG